MEKEKGQIQKPITILSRNMPGGLCMCWLFSKTKWQLWIWGVPAWSWR